MRVYLDESSTTTGGPVLFVERHPGEPFDVLHESVGPGVLTARTLPPDAVELRPVAPTPDPSARIDVYVKARNVMDVDLRQQEIDDGVVVDWWTDRHGVEHVAGVEVLQARAIEVDGVRVVPVPAVPETVEPPVTLNSELTVRDAERERWACWFDSCADLADDMTDGERSGMRHAAIHLRDELVIERVRKIPLASAVAGK